jgi:hypothetical protein
MSDRRDFIRKATLGTIGITTILSCKEVVTQNKTEEIGIMVYLPMKKLGNN